MLKRTFTLLLFSLFVSAVSAQTTVVITDSDLETSEYNWTNDNIYVLDGNVFLEAGGVLNIEAGTVIKGRSVPLTSTDATSALIITRGAQIYANGTVDAPIIFTSDLDDLTTTTDFTALNNQGWGGIIILGNSIVGEDGGTDFIEGIAADEPRGQYGGTDAADNSGSLKYVSIRHGGAVLGADNEINGLTLGGVGNGTTIDYVEVFANKDDGFEFFGGTVNATHIVAAFVGDDSFDYDESWDGYNQFMFSIQQDGQEGLGDNAIEYDGSEETNNEPQTVGRLYNGTFIGSGSGNTNSDGLRLKASGALQLWNSIFYEPLGYIYRVEVSEEIFALSAFAADMGHGADDYVLDNQTFVLDALTAGGSSEVDAELASVSRTTDGNLDPRPVNFNSPAYGGAAQHDGSEAVNTGYRGAFDHGLTSETTWMHGWTALDEYGYLYSTGFTSDVDNVIEGGLALAIEPNPASTLANVSFELPYASDALVQVLDMQGRRVYVENLGFLPSGANQVTLNVASIAQGTYVIIVKTNAGTITSKFVKSNF